MPVGATLAAAAAATATGVYSANKAASSSNKATNAAVAQQERVRQDVDPYIRAGAGALSQISDPNTMLSNFMESPDYQFRKGESLEAVQQGRAVSGLLRSGSALRGTMETAGNLASNEWSNWFQRQFNVAGLGASANATAAGIASNIGNLGVANAGVQGNAALSIGNTINSGLGSIAQLYQQYGGGNAQGSSFKDAGGMHESGHM